MTTIRTVAERAGVSMKTVSRALNNPDSVSSNTRERILAVAEALNFVPDQRARGMRLGRSGVVGLLTDVIASTPCAVDIVRGVEDYLSEQGYSMLIGNTESRAGSSEAVLRGFRASRVEGVIYAATYHRLAEEFHPPPSMPSVLVNCFHSTPDLPTVVPDEERGGYTAIQHLLSLGHRSIVYLTLAPEIEATRLRMKGALRALREAGISATPGTFAVTGQTGTGAFSQAEAYQAAHNLLSRSARPTAIFCGNDEMALQVFNAAADLGIAIPDALSVVGFDDHRLFSEGMRPGLTTVALPYQKMGRLAAELLLKELGGSTQRGVVLVDGPLVVRDSTRAVAGKTAPKPAPARKARSRAGAKLLST